MFGNIQFVLKSYKGDQLDISCFVVLFVPFYFGGHAFDKKAITFTFNLVFIFLNEILHLNYFTKCLEFIDASKI